MRQAADEFHALFPKINPADLIVAVPASPYASNLVTWEGSSVFKDELAKLYGVSLSETADDNGYDINNLYNHRNVAALVWGSNWDLVAGTPILVSYQTQDFCGADPKNVEGLFFGDFHVVNRNTPAIQFHIIALQTEALDGNNPKSGCINVNQINRATAYAVAHSADGIPAFIIGDVNGANPANTNLSQANDLIAGTMCDGAQDWTAPGFPDMNIYEVKTSSGPHVTGIATVADANNPVRVAHFTLPPIQHSVAGVQMSLALPLPPTSQCPHGTGPIRVCAKQPPLNKIVCKVECVKN